MTDIKYDFRWPCINDSQQYQMSIPEIFSDKKIVYPVCFLFFGDRLVNFSGKWPRFVTDKQTTRLKTKFTDNWTKTQT